MNKCQDHDWISFLMVVITTAMTPVNLVQAISTQIQTDNSLLGITTLNIDAAGSNQVYTLSEINGKASGNNLFYSFSHFNIGATDTAWFNLNTPGLANVISRVTGGSQSFIDGQLKMTNEAGGVPSFFFINPAGITFGAGASVDVPGSFYVSTASSLNFSDGTQYHADGTHTSTLSSASPEAFGFLGNETGNLNLGSGVDSGSADLSFKPGAVVALVANQIQIDNATVANADNTQAGIDLQLIGTGEEAINIKLDSLPDQATVGDLTIRKTKLDASGNGSGSITIRAGNTAVTDSNVYASNMGGDSMTTSDGVNVHTNSLSMENSQLESKALSSGNGGNVNVMADQALILRNGAQIATEANSSGNGGTVSVSAKVVDIDRFLNFNKPSSISSVTVGAGSAGAVTVNADLVKIANFSIIGSWTRSTGNAGDVNILTDSLQITRMGSVSSLTFLLGRSGDITVQARQILFNGQNKDEDEFFTGMVNQIWGEDNTDQVPKVITIIVHVDYVTSFIEPFDPNTLNRNMCTADEGSFLLQSGKGGQRLRARDFLLLPM